MKQRFATAAGGGSPSAVFFRWLGWMLALNVAWEIAQMPLYTLPPAPFPFYTAYSIAHCSVGDMLIATAVYLGAAVAAGWHWPMDAPLRDTRFDPDQFIFAAARFSCTAGDQRLLI